MNSRTFTRPLLFLAAAFVAAGGYIHAREWNLVYRYVPSDIAGAWVVRIGFPVNAVVSVLLAGVLVLAATKFSRIVVPSIVATFLFQASSLVVLIATRTGSVFGWAEPVWNDAANQTRAVEIGAMLALGAAGALALTSADWSSERRNGFSALATD